jgi:hypothetical protein
MMDEIDRKKPPQLAFWGGVLLFSVSTSFRMARPRAARKAAQSRKSSSSERLIGLRL